MCIDHPVIRRPRHLMAPLPPYHQQGGPVGIYSLPSPRIYSHLGQHPRPSLRLGSSQTTQAVCGVGVATCLTHVVLVDVGPKLAKPGCPIPGQLWRSSGHILAVLVGVPSQPNCADIGLSSFSDPGRPRIISPLSRLSSTSTPDQLAIERAGLRIVFGYRSTPTRPRLNLRKRDIL